MRFAVFLIAIINQKEKDMKKSFELLKIQSMMQVRRKSVKVIDRHGVERVWAICSSRCVGCCYHGLHVGTVHVCANKNTCELQDTEQ